MIANTLPCGTLSEMSRTACTPPNRLCKPSPYKRTDAGGASTAGAGRDDAVIDACSQWASKPDARARSAPPAPFRPARTEQPGPAQLDGRRNADHRLEA